MNKICQKLVWDSEHFKKKIAKVISSKLKESEFNIVDKWCNKNKIDCIYYLKENNNNFNSLIESNYNYILVDTRVVYILDIKNKLSLYNSDNNLKIEASVNKVNPKLYKIADESISGTRFYNDKKFDIALVRQMYREWINKSISDSKSHMITAEFNGEVIGFICFSIHKKSIAQIGLVAIDRKKRNIGAASVLMNECIKLCKLKKMNTITVATQFNNHPAKMYYEKFGFIKSFQGNWFHKWY